MGALHVAVLVLAVGVICIGVSQFVLIRALRKDMAARAASRNAVVTMKVGKETADSIAHELAKGRSAHTRGAW